MPPEDDETVRADDVRVAAELIRVRAWTEVDVEIVDEIHVSAAVRTAFRNVIDSDYDNIVHEAIQNLPDGDRDEVFDWVVWALRASGVQIYDRE